MSKLLLTTTILCGTVTVVLVILTFVFANLSIIAPTGVEAYDCYESTCFTPSVEGRLSGLYFISSLVTGVFTLVSFLAFVEIDR